MTNWTVKALLPTPPEPKTTTLNSLIFSVGLCPEGLDNNAPRQTVLSTTAFLSNFKTNKHIDFEFWMKQIIIWHKKKKKNEFDFSFRGDDSSTHTHKHCIHTTSPP